MANSHVSYLQTLAKDEAVAFVVSLQKVKEHLSQELHWMNEQAQQKTTQIQGIETLLSEAASLGLVSLPAVSTSTVAATVEADENLATTPSDQETLAATNGNNRTVQPAALTESKAPLPPGKQRQQSKPSKPTPATPPAKAKKPERSTQAASEADKATDASGFQSFLKAKFQAKSMTEAVGEILAAATESLNTDAIMTKLYDGLADEAYQRAKSSLSNILSVGKSKGKWRSPARGLYVGKR